LGLAKDSVVAVTCDQQERNTELAEATSRADTSHLKHASSRPGHKPPFQLSTRPTRRPKPPSRILFFFWPNPSRATVMSLTDLIKPSKADASVRLQNTSFALVALLAVTYLLPLPSPSHAVFVIALGQNVASATWVLCAIGESIPL
jgi:hypothetical protein